MWINAIPENMDLRTIVNRAKRESARSNRTLAVFATETGITFGVAFPREAQHYIIKPDGSVTFRDPALTAVA